MDKLDTLINNTFGTQASNLSSNRDLSGLSATCIQLFNLTNSITDECLQQSNFPNNQTFALEFNNTFNSSTNTSTDRPFIPRWWIQVFWSLLFGIMILAAIVGNVVVIWIVLANRQMRTVTNYFLLNLTIANLAIAIFNAIFNFVYMLNSHWPFGQPYCVINSFIVHLTIAASVFTITATSIDRYVATVYPLKPPMTQKKALSIIIIIWLCASLFALPTLLFSRTLSYRYSGSQMRTLCIMIWPDGLAGRSHYDNVYNIMFLLLTYVVPFVSMAVTYTLIARVLWGSQGIGEFTDIQKESIKSKRKVVRMLMVVVAIFAISWLPYHLYFLWTFYFPHVVHYSFIQHLYLGIYWLAMSNSMYNWMIICYMNRKYDFSRKFI